MDIETENIEFKFKQSDGDSFENIPSLEQQLTFEAAGKVFKRYGVELGAEKYSALGITQKDSDIYTNLALLLSDQCLHTTKIAVFGDDALTVLRDGREFGGSVFRQFEDAVNYLALCNKIGSVVNGVRTDGRDYPGEAVREALLNAFIHRDYSFGGSTIINVNDRKIEFISIGGLFPGLSEGDIRIGISQSRNKKLAEIFRRLRLVEGCGAGIRRIYKLYEKCDAQPVIEATPNAFKIVLPNMCGTAPIPTDESAITYQMREVLDYIRTSDEFK